MMEHGNKLCLKHTENRARELLRTNRNINTSKKIILLREDLSAPCHRSEAGQGVQSSKSDMIFYKYLLIIYTNAV